MNFALNSISKGLFLAFLIFTGAELLKPGSAANFVSLSGLFLLLFLFMLGSVLRPVLEQNELNPMIAAVLTLSLIGGTIFFTYKTGESLGKIGNIITIGAALVAATTGKIIFSKKE